MIAIGRTGNINTKCSKNARGTTVFKIKRMGMRVFVENSTNG